MESKETALETGSPSLEDVNIALVNSFFDACERSNLDRLGAFFTEDAVYHNVPLPRVHGRERIEKVLGGMMKRLDGFEVDMIHIVAERDIVLTERVDTIVIGKLRIPIPLMGVFEVHDGRFRAWRDYFDLAMVLRAFGRESRRLLPWGTRD